MVVSSEISRLSCHSFINRTFQLHRRPFLDPALRSNSKSLVVLSLDGRGAETPTSGTKSLGYTTGANISHVEGTNKPNTIFEEPVSEKNSDLIQDLDVTDQKRAAKIHDFCFGIPYVLSALLLRANVIAYSSTKNLFPAGFYAVISAAMLCFYSYVVISGGNPPPKKKKLSTTSS